MHSDATTIEPAENEVAALPSPAGTPQIDRELVDRCLAGDKSSWQEIYTCYGPGLRMSIRETLGKSGFQLDLSEEVSARIWHSLLENDNQVLANFDVNRGCRLMTYLSAVAKKETLEFLRTERRRIARDLRYSRAGSQQTSVSFWRLTGEVEEFLATLTPAEREFCKRYLLQLPDQTVRQTYSEANIWQLRHRVRQKLQAFVRQD